MAMLLANSHYYLHCLLCFSNKKIHFTWFSYEICLFCV